MCANSIRNIGNHCVGCRACEQLCPTKAIIFKNNEEGFGVPIVNTELCLDCGKCKRHCPGLYKNNGENSVKVVYALKNKDIKEVKMSASGGAANLAAKKILQKKGVVFGAAYTDNLYVKHIEVCREENLKYLQSSKYVQSDLKDTYSNVKNRLDAGGTVLFTGTPCQVAGLEAFLEKKYSNLYTLDLICHGVPSPVFFEKYIAYKEKRLGEKILSYNFRAKDKRGWGTQYILKTKTKSTDGSLTLDKYGNHFVKGDCYRECCYQCQYANTSRVSDMTVGDFWGIEKYKPEFFSQNGVSVVLINTEKGMQLFDLMKEDADVIPCELSNVLKKQGNLITPTIRPPERNNFYKNINDVNFIKELKIGLQLKERIKYILPLSFLQFLKRRVK